MLDFNMLDFNARNLVITWLIGFIVAGLALSALQRRTSDQSCWGANPGWQNEIAIWNLGASVMVVGVLLANAGIEKSLLPGLFILSLAFTANHVVALFRNRDKRYPTNIAAAIANGAGVLILLVYFALNT